MMMPGEDDMEFCHQSVLLEECIENLRIRPEGIYADGTLGAAAIPMRFAEGFPGEEG